MLSSRTTTSQDSWAKNASIKPGTCGCLPANSVFQVLLPGDTYLATIMGILQVPLKIPQILSSRDHKSPLEVHGRALHCLMSQHVVQGCMTKKCNTIAGFGRPFPRECGGPVMCFHPGLVGAWSTPPKIPACHTRTTRCTCPSWSTCLTAKLVPTCPRRPPAALLHPPRLPLSPYLADSCSTHSLPLATHPILGLWTSTLARSTAPTAQVGQAVQIGQGGHTQDFGASQDDIIIDVGNANFRDQIRRRGC